MKFKNNFNYMIKGRVAEAINQELFHKVVAELNQYIRESNASAKQSKSHTATENISE